MLTNHPKVDRNDFTIFPLSPLIQTTLLLLYLAIVLPLPLLAPDKLRFGIIILLLLGIIFIWGVLGESIIITASKIRVRYPSWYLWPSSHKWEIKWNTVNKLITVRTSQGGSVYYIVSKGNKAHLMPQRIARFDEFIKQFIELSGISVTSMKKLTPPWTYQLLAILSSLMIFLEILIFFSIRFMLI